MTCDQEQYPVAGGDRTFKPPVYGLPCAVETVTMEIKSPVRLDPPGTKSSVPSPVERSAMVRNRRFD
jgi:hypothetical protein